MSIFYKDPGANNEFPKDNMGRFDSVSYLKNLSDELLSIDESLIIEASKILSDAILNKNQIFFCGNGGSFAIAEHMVCDYAKGMQRFYKERIFAFNLGSNKPLNSALTNDFGHDLAYQAELEMYAKKNDVLIAISSSGNSKNVLNCVNFSNNNNITSIGLSGFGGGELSNISNLSFVSNQKNYPAVEASHQIFLDCVAFMLWK